MSSLFNQASLVIEPAVYEASKLYATKPFDGSGDLTFTRSLDTATRVAENGLIERVRTNEALNSVWNGVGSNVAPTSWTNGFTTGSYESAVSSEPNNTAIRFFGTTARRYVFLPFSSSGIFTFSFFVESVATSSAISNVFFPFNSISISYFEDGVSILSSKVIEANKRYSIVFNAASVSELRMGGGATTNATYDFVISRPQLETSDIATPYIPTTTAAVSVGMLANVPRLDYLGGGCPKLLLEPQRTNVITFSEQIDNAAYTKLNSSITANAGISPDGFVNADKLVENTANTFHLVGQNRTLAVGLVAYSFYAKAAGRSQLRIDAATTELSPIAHTFNLDNGTSVGGFIEPAANGFFRCSGTFNVLVAGTRGIFIVLLNSSGVTNYLGDGVSGALLYGIQYEQASYATSYIPTLGAAVTRSADAASKTGISALIGQTEGTLFVEFTINGFQSDYATTISINDGVPNNYVWLTIFSNGNLRAEVWNGTVQSQIIYSGAVVGGRYKMAFGYKTNDFALYVNGALVGTDVSGATFSGTTLSRVDNNLAGIAPNNVSQSTHQALLFKTRLSNAALAELTAL